MCQVPRKCPQLGWLLYSVLHTSPSIMDQNTLGAGDPCALVSHIFLSLSGALRTVRYRALVSGVDITSDTHCSVVSHSSYYNPGQGAPIMVWTHGPLSFGSTRTHNSRRVLGLYRNIYFCSALFYSIQDLCSHIFMQSAIPWHISNPKAFIPQYRIQLNWVARIVEPFRRHKNKDEVLFRWVVIRRPHQL